MSHKPPKKRKQRPRPSRSGEQRAEDRLIAQANARHKLFDSLDPKAREFAQREFAKLGLY